MKKQNIIWFTIIVLIIVFASSAAIYASRINNEDENKLLKTKVKEEINYLDSKIVSMLNSLNNIDLQNYIVQAEEIDTQNDQSQSDSSSSQQEGKKSASGGESQEQGQGGSQSGGGSSSEGKEESSKTTMQMKKNTVIDSDRTPRWDDLKSNIENLYSSWNVIILDLYKLNIDGNKILEFSDLLDKLTLNIKEENKQEALKTLTNMYSSIVGYVNDFSSEEGLKKILTARENIFYAYANVDSKNWEEVQLRIAQAEKDYVEKLNNENNKEKEFNLNKGYILLKELQNSISEQDEDIFYIKYKNLIEELNLLMS